MIPFKNDFNEYYKILNLEYKSQKLNLLENLQINRWKKSNNYSNGKFEISNLPSLNIL